MDGEVKDKDKGNIKLITQVAFEAADTNKSGYLEPAELEQVLNNVAADIGI